MVNKKAKIKFFFFFSKFSLTQRSQVSTVPNKHRSSATAVLTSETLSSSQRSLTALKYVVIGRPHWGWGVNKKQWFNSYCIFKVYNRKKKKVNIVKIPKRKTKVGVCNQRDQISERTSLGQNLFIIKIVNISKRCVLLGMCKSLQNLYTFQLCTQSINEKEGSGNICIHLISWC